MDPSPEKDEEEKDEDLKDEQKGLLIILGSLVVISTIVIIGIFIFFPFNSQVGPAIVIEKNTPTYSESDRGMLEKNEFLSGLNQGLESTKTSSEEKTASEEFFLEILPDSGKVNANTSKPVPATEPIYSSSPAPSTNVFDNAASAPQQKVPAIVSRPESVPASPDSVTNTPAKPKKVQSTPSAPKSPSFWVQIGSYSDEKLANSVIEKLKQEGFEAKKIQFNDGSRTLNRVRMGPYANKNEANKFLAWIHELPDFKESYVLQTNN